MKYLVLFAVIFSASVGLAQHEHKSTNAIVDTLKKSIPKEVHAQVGEAHMMIKYHSPAVRGRTIWGGLVPFGEIWVTGAHSATSWEFTKDIIVDSKVVPAGKYAIFTIPGENTWTVIINKKWDQHLADEYDIKEDILRLEVKPTPIPKQERLLYKIESKGSSGRVEISWEMKKVTLPFKTVN